MKLAILAVASTLCAVILVPVLFVVIFAGWSSQPATCGAPATLTADGSPTIVGNASLSAEQIVAWWTGLYGPNTPLGISVAELVGDYQNSGDAEGVRWDYAIAQAFVETSSAGLPFNSGHAVQQNNFAGINVDTNSSVGDGWPTPAQGVAAQIEMLKQVVDGDNTPFAEPDVSPGWAGKAGITTWAGLAGNWAANPDYWSNPNSTDTISGWYAKMSVGTPSATLDGVNSPATTTATASGGTGTTTTTVAADNGCASSDAGTDCAPVSAANDTASSAPASSAPDPLAAMWLFLCQQIGKPYQWGGSGPNSWDCSGLTQAGYAQVGVSLPHNAALQYDLVHATDVPPSQLVPGDLVFFEGVPPGHVAIIIKAASGTQPPMMIQAPQTGEDVDIVPLWTAAYDGAGIPVLPAAAL